MVPSLSCMKALVFTKGSPTCMEASQALARLRRALERTRTQAVCIRITHRRTVSVYSWRPWRLRPDNSQDFKLVAAPTPGSSDLKRTYCWRDDTSDIPRDSARGGCARPAMQYKAAYSVDTFSASQSTTSREKRWLEDRSWVASERPTPPFAVIFTGRLDVHDDEALMRAPVAWLLAFHTRVLWRCRCGHLWTAGVHPGLRGKIVRLEQREDVVLLS
jgi:hypothetical protein